MERREKVLEQMKEHADEKYKAFNDRILNSDCLPTLGIRVPVLRKMAGQIAKDHPEEWLEELRVSEDRCIYQEEHMAMGMVIGYMKGTEEQRKAYLDRWIPGILSWADCDTCVSTFKWMKKNQSVWFDYICGWLFSPHEFEVRFAVVALMDHFMEEGYIDDLLKIYESIENKAYYVKMAVAWALSVCYIKFPEKTLAFFKENTLDDWVQNKAIQKCRESFRISKEEKEFLNTLKRK